MTDIEIIGLERVQRKLRTIEDINKHLGPPMTAALLYVRRRVSQVPPRHKGPVRWQSEKQRRFYFAMVRRHNQWRAAEKATGIKPGQGYFIGYAYKRTNTLQRKWTERIVVSPAEIVGTLGNNTPYARYVIGDRQQMMHADTGWRKVDDVVRDATPKVQQIFNAAIKRIING